MKKTIERRSFLCALGASTALVPFLPAQLASAGQPTGPKRFVVWWNANGIFNTELYPATDGPLVEMKRVLAPLAAHRDRILLPRNLDWLSYRAFPTENDHSPCVHAITAAAVARSGSTPLALGPSVDQYLAQRLGRAGSYDGLVLGVDSYWPEAMKICFRDARDPVPGQSKPAETFKTLFGSTAPGTSAEEALRADRKSVIDNVRLELESLRKRLAVEDRRKIDAHLEFIRAQELRLTGQYGAPVGGACRPPTLEAGTGTPTMLRDARPQIDNLVAALQCDATRVAALIFGAPGGASDILYGWLPGVTDRHHGLSHGGSSKPGQKVYESVTQIGAWHASNLAYFLDRLAAVPEGEGSMLDNTLVLWTTEHAGNIDGGHSRRYVPYVLVGSAGGYFKTGRVIDFKGRAHNDLFVSICHAMGFEDVKTFGYEKVCGGPLPGLTTT